MTKTFCDNPWKLSTVEAETLWMLTEFDRDAVAERQGVHYSSVSHRLAQIRVKMQAPTLIAAAIEFDRWWQAAKASVPASVLTRMELELLEPVEARL